MARERRGTWFDPELVRALEAIEGDGDFWARLSSDEAVPADDEALDRIASAFARVIDAKSPFTARHSGRVAEIAVGIGRALDLSEGALRQSLASSR